MDFNCAPWGAVNLLLPYLCVNLLPPGPETELGGRKGAGALIPERMGGNGDARGSVEGAVTPKAAGRNLFDDVTGLAPRAGAV